MKEIHSYAVHIFRMLRVWKHDQEGNNFSLPNPLALYFLPTLPIPFSLHFLYPLSMLT